MNDLFHEKEPSRMFFESIKAGNFEEIINFFRNSEYIPWTYLEEDEYSGILKILNFIQLNKFNLLFL